MVELNLIMSFTSNKFIKVLSEHSLDLNRNEIKTLQLNLGMLCNLACLHCHVEAGPKRTELMQLPTIERILKLLDADSTIETVDLTGGAPEMNPHFRFLVDQLTKKELNVIVRSNLTVLFEEGFLDLAEFFAAHKVIVIASLPCYTSENVDAQRGRGVFESSIEALKLLNQLGYGKESSELKLHLVYNPLGASLPPDQSRLREDYKQSLYDQFGIVFNDLYTITNMPIKRFLRQLEKEAKLDQYMQLLVQNFNPQAALGVMCRDLISVSFDGKLHDCDFNQMLNMPLAAEDLNVWNIDSFAELGKLPIFFKEHCFGCTAGSGSSCGGALV